MQEDEEKVRRRDEGKKLHALYHMEVDKIAAKFLLKRKEEEMNLNQEMLKKKELRKLEEEMHDRIIESVHLENERVKQLREKRLENKKLKDEEHKKEKERLRREWEAKQRQERVELVKKLIEESKNWVTEENLDEKIAFCLENEINYNFALTPSGEKISSTLPPGCIDTVENAPGPAANYPTGLPSNPEKQELDVR